MAITRSSLAALVAAQASIGIALERVPLTTEDAMTLAAEVTPEEAKHPSLLASSLPALQAAVAVAVPEGMDAALERAAGLKAASDAFWQAFEGQSVEGVEIIRRRA